MPVTDFVLILVDFSKSSLKFLGTRPIKIV